MARVTTQQVELLLNTTENKFSVSTMPSRISSAEGGFVHILVQFIALTYLNHLFYLVVSF